MTARPGPRALLAAALMTAVALGALPPPHAARAQSVGLENKSKEPVTIEADDGIEWHQQEKIYLARGKARATRGDVTIRAETLTALYRDLAGGKTEVYEVVADGGVLITTPREKITGDTGVYDVDKGVFRLTGKSLLIETPEERVSARDKIEYFSQEKKAVLVGDATVIKDNRKVRADTMTARFAEDAKGKMALSRADIVGNVVITTPTEVARANSGVYNADSGIATLTGAVKLTRGDNQLNGEFAEVNLKTGISRLLASPTGAAPGARVRGVFVPRSGEEGEGGEGGAIIPGLPNAPGGK
jgi:lipopolysaccharide export system protein LptA